MQIPKISPMLSPMIPAVDRQFSRTLSEAASISSGTLDFCWLLGLAFGMVFGFALPENLSGNLDLGTQIVETALLDKLASLVVALIVSVRVILARGMRDQSPISSDDGQHVIWRHMLATAWASAVALFHFLLAALIGYALGLFMGAPGLAMEMLDGLAQSYSLATLGHVTIRVLVEAVMISWISFFDMIMLSGAQESLSRAITRRILMLAAAILAIETLDAYLDWTVF